MGIKNTSRIIIKKTGNKGLLIETDIKPLKHPIYKGLLDKNINKVRKDFGMFLYHNLDQWSEPPLKNIKKTLGEIGFKVEKHQGLPQNRGYGWFFHWNGKNKLMISHGNLITPVDFRLMEKAYQQKHGRLPGNWNLEIGKDKEKIGAVLTRRENLKYVRLGHDSYGNLFMKVDKKNSYDLEYQLLFENKVIAINDYLRELVSILDGVFYLEALKIKKEYKKMDIDEELSHWMMKNGFSNWQGAIPKFKWDAYPKNCVEWWQGQKTIEDDIKKRFPRF